MAHYRNHKIFEERVNEFKNQMGIRFNTCYIPMFYKSSKLSNQILDAYSKLNGYTDGTFIRHSIIGDEANARCLSYTEHDPNSKVAGDFREALMGVHESLSKTIH
jgi:cellulose biosynthesis protein BcsQ